MTIRAIIGITGRLRIPSWIVASTYSSAPAPPSPRTSSRSRVVGGRGAQQPLERPGQRVGGRLVAGEHERQELVAQLVVGQRLARPRRWRRAAARGCRRGARGRRRRAARGSPRTSGGRASPAPPRARPWARRGRRSAARRAGTAAMVEAAEHAPDRLAQPALGVPRCRPALDPEDRRHDHVERDRLHPRRERERLAHRPAVDLALGDLGDHLPRSAAPPRRGTAAAAACAGACGARRPRSAPSSGPGSAAAATRRSATAHPRAWP